MNATDILIAARAKVEQGWTQYMNASDAKGNKVGIKSPQAACWCMNGAILASCEGDFSPVKKAVNFLNEATNYPDFTLWNDKRERTQ